VSVPEVFNYWLQPGRIDVGFLGAAQIDRYGNINTTVLGPYERPRVRLPGSGGAPEIAIHAKRTLVVARLERRIFPEAVDFVTSPGHRTHGRSRRELGMPGAGPTRVITDRGILDADLELDGELVLTAVYPGVTVEEVRANVGWELRIREPLSDVEMPSEDVLRVLRGELDPDGRYLGGA
jgi:glutaconate CoA-transferase, subunit B